MKIRTILAAAAATFALTALPAAAQSYGGYGGWDRGGAITVKHDAGVFRFQPGEREYRRLVRNFGFEPGHSYEYSHSCNGYGCIVVEYAPGRRRPVDRFRAPYFVNAFDGGRVPGNPYHNDSRERRRWR